MQDETIADHSETELPEEEAKPEEDAQNDTAPVEEAEPTPEPDDEAAPLPESGVTESEDEAAEEAAPAKEPESEPAEAATANLESPGLVGEDEPAEDTGPSAEEIEARASAWLHSSASDGKAAEEQRDETVKAEAEPVVKVSESDEEEEFEEDLPEIIAQPPDDGVVRRWYAIHAHSGQEGNVQQALIVKAEQAGMQSVITNVFVPMEEVAEYKSGEKRLSKRKFFPGYVLVQLPEHPEKNADLWHLIKDTPGVTGFIGSRTEPVPLEDSEVLALVEEMRGERERPRPKVAFEVGERVKINDGAFANFLGNIGEINEDRGKMKVLIEIFERQTSVEVEFWQVEKI